MNELRKVPFLIAYALLLIAVSLEIGAHWFAPAKSGISDSAVHEVQKSYEGQQPTEATVRENLQKAHSDHPDNPPGEGVPALWLVDAVLAMSLTWMLLAFFISGSVQSKVQGIVSLIVGAIIVVTSVVKIYTLFPRIIMMASLVAAVPFGTLIYVAIWGGFDVEGAKTILTVSFLLKAGFCVFLMIANPQFLKIRSLVLLIVTSLALNLLVAYLHGMVPVLLASITDAIAGIICAAGGIVWAIAVIAGSITSILKLLPTKIPGT